MVICKNLAWLTYISNNFLTLEKTHQYPEIPVFLKNMFYVSVSRWVSHDLIFILGNIAEQQPYMLTAYEKTPQCSLKSEKWCLCNFNSLLALLVIHYWQWDSSSALEQHKEMLSHCLPTENWNCEGEHLFGDDCGAIGCLPLRENRSWGFKFPWI